MNELSEKSDENLARLVQAGNDKAFSLLVERYSEKIIRYGQKFLRSHQDIEDEAQAVFIKAYKNINSFNPKRKFSPWIYRIAHNEFVNRIRKDKKSPILPFSLDIFLPYLSGGQELEKEAEREETKGILDNYMDKLPEKYLEPLILYYFEDMDYKEISRVMRIPVSTVGVRLKRGRDKLKEIIEADERF